MDLKASTRSMVWMGGKGESKSHHRVLTLALISTAVVLVAVSVLALVSAVRPDVSSGVLASIEASSARWSALGQYWSAGSRARAADVARWVALGESYTRDYQGIAAVNSARYQALGNLYRSRIEAGVEASSARWAALGTHHQARYEAAAMASSVRYQALAKDHGLQVVNYERGAAASSARWAALGAHYGQAAESPEGSIADSGE